MKDVFIIGSRGLPAQYGGFETFVDQLVSNQVSSQIKYHVACLSNDQAYHHFDYKGVDCFTIKAPKLGPARVIAYDMMAIDYALKLIQKEEIKEPFVGKLDEKFIYFYNKNFTNRDLKSLLKEHLPYKEIVIYTKKSTISKEELKSININIRFIPYDIKEN